MNAVRRRRLLLVSALVIGVGVAVTLALMAFRQNLMYYYTPTDVHEGKAPSTRSFRTGGLVKQGSLHRDPDGVTVRFTITDLKQEMIVLYRGILPDLFREGQGIIANGRVGPNGVFTAKDVLAKHDENYMPPEVAASLKKSGAMPQHEMVKEKNKL
ncbi:MAG: cytochrome c maturation protein CcmE [Gammaproteobacteria bacterium]|nr:cytochrome c maturation protein CcmE [Gammaproteobacteria bacterium]